MSKRKFPLSRTPETTTPATLDQNVNSLCKRKFIISHLCPNRPTKKSILHPKELSFRCTFGNDAFYHNFIYQFNK